MASQHRYVMEVSAADGLDLRELPYKLDAERPRGFRIIDVVTERLSGELTAAVTQGIATLDLRLVAGGASVLPIGEANATLVRENTANAGAQGVTVTDSWDLLKGTVWVGEQLQLQAQTGTGVTLNEGRVAMLVEPVDLSFEDQLRLWDQVNNAEDVGEWVQPDGVLEDPPRR